MAIPSQDLPTANALPIGARERRAAVAVSTPGPEMSQQLARSALRDEETNSARSMIRVGRLLGCAVLLPLPVLGGSDGLRIAFAAATVLALAVGWLVERRLVAGVATPERTIVVLALSVSPAIFIGVLYFGIFSAVQLFPALSLYFFCRREHLRTALALYLANSIAQLAFASLVVGGAFADPGLIVPSLPRGDLVIGHVLIQVAFFCAFLMGRGAYRASREAIDRLQHAMQLAAQKDALLVEAREDLDRALAIGGPGRYTDQRVGGFRLGNVLGRGGMGEVYEAWHVDSGEPAAVKLLPQRELGNTESVERFLRELRAVRALQSPHVVRVLAAADEREPVPYLAMERLSGHDLAHHLRTGRVPASSLVEMLAQVGGALEEAWGQGIVHRDLKPQNIFLDDGPPPRWKVLDFGVAALEEHSGSLTQGRVIGTPAYMAPEQARGERVDHRADVYALAAIAYRWLAGRPPCSGRDLHAALYQTVHVMPQRPSELAPELHADVDAALALGLVKRAEDRWSSARELRDALAAALDGNLDPALRERAAEQLEWHPWGAVRG